MTEPTQERPLLTFALFAYNQERFIREAVEGALAQTYSPLQVILSDDGSSDRTFEIMQEMVADYSGPHEILLNRNAQNLGIGGHVNRVMELVKGELIVVAAGDDVSIQNRVELICKTWLKSGKPICSIYSKVMEIDEYGVDLGLNGDTWNSSVSIKNLIGGMVAGPLGSSHAWHREIFDIFGPMLPNSIYEDRILPFRSYLVGTIIFISNPLVKYRVHIESICSRERGLELAKNLEVIFDRKMNVFDNYEKDLMVLSKNPNLLKNESLGLLFSTLLFIRNDATIRYRMLTSSLKERLFLLWSVKKYIDIHLTFIYLAIFLSPYFYLNLLPEIKKIRKKIKQKFNCLIPNDNSISKNIKERIMRKIGLGIQLLKLYKLIKIKDDNREKPPYKLMYFCGSKGIDYLNSSLLSVYKNWIFLPDIIIITDGTPISFIKNRLIKWPRNIEIDTWESCANFFSKKGNSSLFNYAKNELWGKKFVSILANSEKNNILYSDTDVLWFCDPRNSLAIDKPLPYIKMSQDIEHCYSDLMLNHLDEFLIKKKNPLNAGVIYISGDFSKYPKWEHLCKYLETNADNRTEQTGFAILSSYFGEVWSNNEIFLEVNDMSSVFSYRFYKNFVARHYVNTKQWLFWRDFLLFLIVKLKFCKENYKL